MRKMAHKKNFISALQDLISSVMGFVLWSWNQSKLHHKKPAHDNDPRKKEKQIQI